MGLKYLPVLSLDVIKDMVDLDSTEQISRELLVQTYERIGLDRIYIILDDINTNYGKCNGFSFLDVGCNNGLLSNLLSAYANDVLGIDDFIINSQGRYEDLQFNGNNMASFEKIDVLEYLKTSNKTFDFVLLLSVAHQWEYGYAHDNASKKSDNDINYILNILLERTKKAIYYECPMNEPGFEENYGISFLKKHLMLYDMLSIVKIADTIASNGYMRSLYRISRKTDYTFNEFTNYYKKLQSIKTKYNIPGEIVINGNQPMTKYAIKTDRSLIVSINGQPRDETHPLGKQNRKNIIELWEKIKNNQPLNVVKVQRIFQEGYAEIGIVPGFPGIKLDSIPPWQCHNQANSKDVDTLMNTQKILCNLSFGLGELHQLNIAHGDPYLYNAILNNTQATWIDLGNISSGEQDIIKDIFCFFMYSVYPLLANSREFSLNLLNDIENIFKEEKDIHKLLLKIANILDSTIYHDVRERTSKDIIIIAEYFSRIFSYLFDKQSDLKYLPIYNLYHYFTDAIAWMNSSACYKKSNQFLKKYIDYSQSENARLRLSIDQYTIMKNDYEKLKNDYKVRVEQDNEEISFLENELTIQKKCNQDLTEKVNQLTTSIEKEKIESHLMTEKIKQIYSSIIRK